MGRRKGIRNAPGRRAQKSLRVLVSTEIRLQGEIRRLQLTEGEIVDMWAQAYYAEKEPVPAVPDVAPLEDDEEDDFLALD